MLRVECLSVEQFAAMREPWQELLQMSNADPLFMSWHWQFGWWQQWREDIGAELRLFSAWHGDRLVGLMPLYLCKAKIRFISMSRLQFIGNNWAQKSTVRSEYLQPIADRDYENDVVDVFVDNICSQTDWHEFVLCDLLDEGRLAKYLRKRLNYRSICAVRRDQDHGFCIRLAYSYSEYLKTLGRNTRLKLHNRRKLATAVDNDFKYCSEASGGGESYREKFFSQLNNFHCDRWGKPAFKQDARSFHMAFMRSIESDKNYCPELSEIRAGLKTLSVLYNLGVGDRVYNLQAGYDEQWHNKIALGTLHLGYSIERAFTEQYQYFDLLLGRGKSSDYKSKFSGELVNTSTWIYSRTFWIKWIYGIRAIVFARR